MRRISKRLYLLLLPLLFVGAVLACSRHLAEPTGLLELGEGEIRFPATVSAQGFTTGMSGYHLVVWKQGRAAHPALFRADVTDTEALDGLELLGAKPGNALGLDTWEERDNEDSDASDQVIEGPLVEILVETPGRAEPLTLPDIFEDPGGRGFEMRFGGHRDNISEWRSGCVACLYSCPGSKVGNARYTVRDYVRGTTDFRIRDGVLPADGTQVTIIIRLVQAPNGAATDSQEASP